MFWEWRPPKRCSGGLGVSTSDSWPLNWCSNVKTEVAFREWEMVAEGGVELLVKILGA